MMGGFVGEDNQESASVITYDAEADAWHTAPSLPLPCRTSSCRASSIDQGILFPHVGGVLRYDQTHGWQSVAGPAENLPRSVCELLLLG